MTPKPQTLSQIHEEKMRMSRGATMRTESENRLDVPDFGPEYRNITGNIRQLRENLSQLEEAIAILEKTLGPILSPEDVEKSPGMTEGTDPGMSGMAEELRIMVHTVDALRRAVAMIRERVDI